MKVRCINDTNGVEGLLTLNKIYEVLAVGEDSGCYLVVNDIGNEDAFQVSRFQAVEENSDKKPTYLMCYNGKDSGTIDGKPNLTTGKEYELIRDGHEVYVVVSNNGHRLEFDKKRFESQNNTRIENHIKILSDVAKQELANILDLKDGPYWTKEIGESAILNKLLKAYKMGYKSAKEFYTDKSVGWGKSNG